ncbi:MAG: type II toxin-antitoxin system RelE/ParE family toxin [Bacteroidales bacterium]
MKLVYTEQSLISLEEAIEFIAPKVSHEKLIEIRDKILDAADKLLEQPFAGQREYLLDHLELGHRRLVEGHYKIIYRVADEYIFITDIFDSRQDPVKMKG